MARLILTLDTTLSQDNGLARANALANAERVPPDSPLTDEEYLHARVVGLLDSYAAQDIGDYAERVAAAMKADPMLADSDPAAVLVKVPREKPVDDVTAESEIKP
jgi:hypothetical protein